MIPCEIGLELEAVSLRATWIRKRAITTEAVTWRTGVAIMTVGLHRPGLRAIVAHMPKPPAAPPEGSPGEPWVPIRFKVPASWKRWLQEAADHRALTVSALVRQLIRNLMLERHGDGGL